MTYLQKALKELDKQPVKENYRPELRAIAFALIALCFTIDRQTTEIEKGLEAIRADGVGVG